MDIFNSSVGYESTDLLTLITWFVSASALVFAAFAVKGTYVRLLSSKTDPIGAWSDVVVLMCLLAIVTLIIN